MIAVPLEKSSVSDDSGGECAGGGGERPGLTARETKAVPRGVAKTPGGRRHHPWRLREHPDCYPRQSLAGVSVALYPEPRLLGSAPCNGTPPTPVGRGQAGGVSGAGRQPSQR